MKIKLDKWGEMSYIINRMNNKEAKTMAWFKITKSIIYPNSWQVRVRNDVGMEDTVDHLFSIEECRKKWDVLSREMTPLLPRP